MSNSAITYNHKLVAEFCDSEFAPRSRGFLVPYAAHVVYIARMCRSTRLTAAFLSKKFDRTFSRRPVEDILAKVKKGEIVVTPEQLAQVAAEHPMAQHYAERLPDMLNPTSKMEIEDAPTPAAKKSAATKKAKTTTKKAKATTEAPTAKTVPPEHDAEEPPAVTTIADEENRSPEKQKQFAALERLQKLIPS